MNTLKELALYTVLAYDLDTSELPKSLLDCKDLFLPVYNLFVCDCDEYLMHCLEMQDIPHRYRQFLYCLGLEHHNYCQSCGDIFLEPTTTRHARTEHSGAIFGKCGCIYHKKCLESVKDCTKCMVPWNPVSFVIQKVFEAKRLELAFQHEWNRGIP